jgi:mannosyltransferase OCH1-like enzyme
MFQKQNLMTTLKNIIPKIIHQTGPSDKTKWHKLWHACQTSWKDNYSDFTYNFWSDEQIDNLVATYYPEFQQMYNNFPVHIMKIDFARFAILHHVGGIYADLDVYCYQNFYSELIDSSYIVENPFGNDPFENSLMCAAPNSDFFYRCMELSLERWNYTLKVNPDFIKNIKLISKNINFGLDIRPYFVFYITGTQLLSSAYRKYSNITSTLPGITFNNDDMSYDPSYRTKHIHTGLWGKENLEILEKKPKSHINLRNIPVDKFDFYKDYTNGNYLKTNFLDVYKNDNETHPFLGVSYDYS